MSHSLQTFPIMLHTHYVRRNVMISDEGRPVLMDFGSCLKARIKIENRSQALLQQDIAAEQSTMAYRAPELVLGWDHDYAVDWWSFGLVLHWICTGRVSASQIWLFVRHVSQDGRSTPSWTEREVGIRRSCAA